jgi:TrkA domain protein
MVGHLPQNRARKGLRTRNVREADLPGIGRTFQAALRSGERIVVHDDGRRELYLFEEKDRDRSSAVIGLDDEARQIAGILGGMAYTPRALETVDMALEDLLIQWYRVEPGSPAEGRAIGEMGIRQNFGVTVVAIIGEDRSKVAPDGVEVLALELGIQDLVDPMDRDVPVYRVAAVAKLADVGFFVLIELVPHLVHDLLQDVLYGDEPLERAPLVDNDDHLDLLLLEVPEDPTYGSVFGYGEDLAREVAGRDTRFQALGLNGAHHIPDMHRTDDPVG